MRLFANQGPMGKLLQNTFEEGEELTHPLLNRSIETAQRKVEQQHFSVRKRLLQYDDVLNRQREVVYGIRNDALHTDSPRDIIFEMIREELDERIDAVDTGAGPIPEEGLKTLLGWVNGVFPIAAKPEEFTGQPADSVQAELLTRIEGIYAEKAELEDDEHFTNLERHIVIRAIDRNWQDHLTEMEELRRSVGLRSYGQKDPLIEYKTEAFKEFSEMMARVRQDMCAGTFRTATSVEVFKKLMEKVRQQAVTVGPSDNASGQPQVTRADGSVVPQKPQESPANERARAQRATKAKVPHGGDLPKVEPAKRELPKLGRNEVVHVCDPKTGDVQSMKFKKAESLIRDKGWQLVRKP